MNNKKSLKISTRSKKITKRSKTTRLVPQEVTKPREKYQTTKKKEKAQLLDKIRKIVDPEFQNENWNQGVAKYKPKEYRELLDKLYPNLVTAKEIRSKWKNMKRMLNNIKKSDGRGGALLANEEEKKEFKRHLEYVIKHKMKTRSFERLRKYVLPKIYEMFAKNGRPLPDQPFQKHFWSYYHKAAENVDIKKEWKKLPRTKPQSSSKDNDDSSFISEMMDKSESNDDNHDDQSIFDEEDGPIVEEILPFEEVRDVDIEVTEINKCLPFGKDDAFHCKNLIPVESFLNRDPSFGNKGPLNYDEEIVFEVPWTSLDHGIINFFDK